MPPRHHVRPLPHRPSLSVTRGDVGSDVLNTSGSWLRQVHTQPSAAHLSSVLGARVLSVSRVHKGEEPISSVTELAFVARDVNILQGPVFFKELLEVDLVRVVLQVPNEEFFSRPCDLHRQSV